MTHCCYLLNTPRTLRHALGPRRFALRANQFIGCVNEMQEISAKDFCTKDFCKKYLRMTEICLSYRRLWGKLGLREGIGSWSCNDPRGVFATVHQFTMAVFFYNLPFKKRRLSA
jgi:hypothetical protein